MNGFPHRAAGQNKSAHSGCSFRQAAFNFYVDAEQDNYNSGERIRLDASIKHI